MQFWGLLAYRLQALGFRIERTHERGSFEIAGISPESIQAFSTRSQQIRRYMQRFGLSGAAAAAYATKQTREAKSTIDRDTLAQRWKVQQQLKQVDTQGEVDQLTKQLQAATRHHPTTNQMATEKSETLAISDTQRTVAVEAISRSIDSLSKTDAVLDHFRLVNLALSNTIGQSVSPTVIEKVIAEQVSAGKLLPLPDRKMPAYTTQALLDKETELIKLALTVTQPIPDLTNRQQQVTAALADSPLPNQAKQVATQLFTRQSLMVLVDGIDHQNRETILQAITQSAQATRQEVVLLTAQKAAEADLIAHIPIASVSVSHWFKRTCLGAMSHETIAHFITRTQQGLGRQLTKATSLIVVDQAERQSLSALTHLAQLAQERQATLVLLGDQVAPNFPTPGCYQQLIEQGAQVIQAGDAALDRMTLLKEKVIPHVIGIKDEVARWEHMIHRYLAFHPAVRSEVLMVVPNVPLKESLNIAVHEARVTSGELKGEERYHCEVCVPGKLPYQQLGVATAWKTGQWLYFHQSYRREKIVKGWCAKIEAIYPKRNELVLVDQRGQMRTLDPRRLGQNCNQQVQCYQLVKREFSPGERLVVGISDARQGIYRGEHCTLIQIHQGRFQLARASGQVVMLSPTHLPALPIDYGYVTMRQSVNRLHRAAHLITYCHSASRGLAKRLEGLARQAEQCTIYTDEKNRLLVNLNAPQEKPLTALQAVVGSAAMQSAQASSGTADYLPALVAIVQAEIERATRQQNFQAAYRPVLSAAELSDQAVAFALAHLSEREAAFSQQAIIETAMGQVFGKVKPAEINQAIQRAEERGQLIPGIYWYQRYFTTELALVREQQVVDRVKSDQGKLSPLLTTEQMALHFQQHPTFEDNQTLLQQWFASRDRVLLLQGVAGAGKTTLLDNAVNALTDSGYPVTLLGPTHSAVTTIRHKGVQAETLARFLEQRPSHQQSAMTALLPIIYIIDEATLTSTQVNLKFLLTAHQLNARVLVMGDRHQPSGVEAGNDFSILQRLGVTTLVKDQSYRQQSKPYQQAIQSLYAGEFRKALEQITVINAPWTEDYTNQEAAPEQPLIDQTVQCYFQFSADRRQGILLSTPTNALRHDLNVAIQSVRRQQEALSLQYLEVTVFQNVGQSRAQLSDCQTYQAGQVLYFVRDVPTFGLQAKTYYTITKIDAVNQRLTLQNAQGQAALYQPNGEAVQCYEPHPRTFYVGDRLVMTRHHVIKQNQAAIFFDLLAIDGQTLHLQPLTYKKSQGLVPVGSPQPLDMTITANQHIDLGYCVTIMTAQGLENQITLAAMPSAHPYLTHQKNLLEVITRGVDEAIVVTDNKLALLATLSQATGEKTSALEAVGHPLLVKPPIADAPSIQPDELHTQPSAPQKNASKRKATVVSNPPRLDGQAIASSLADQAARIVRYLLGEPRKVVGETLRYGKNQGSLIVTVEGPRRGLWYDFGSGEGGNLFHLIAKQQGLVMPNDYRKVLEVALKLLGQDMRYFESTSTLTQTSKVDAPVYDTDQPATWTTKQKSRIYYAQQLVKQSQPISGTLAEHYLRHYRGIELDQWPKSCRFHPGLKTGLTQQPLPALLAVYTNDKGNIRAAQAIFLDPATGQKVNPTTQPHLAKINKQTFGVLKQGACYFVQRVKCRQKSYLAEGVETGLTVLMADPSATVHVSLGLSGLANISPNILAKQTIICLDNDGKAIEALRPVHRAVDHLLQAGKQVSLVMPPQQGMDCNDVLQKTGIKSVKALLEQTHLVESVEGLKQQALTMPLSTDSAKLIDYQSDKKDNNDRQQAESESVQDRDSHNHSKWSSLDKEVEFN